MKDADVAIECRCGLMSGVARSCLDGPRCSGLALCLIDGCDSAANSAANNVLIRYIISGPCTLVLSPHFIRLRRLTIEYTIPGVVSTELGNIRSRSSIGIIENMASTISGGDQTKTSNIKRHPTPNIAYYLRPASRRSVADGDARVLRAVHLLAIAFVQYNVVAAAADDFRNCASRTRGGRRKNRINVAECFGRPSEQTTASAP